MKILERSITYYQDGEWTMVISPKELKINEHHKTFSGTDINWIKLFEDLREIEILNS